MPHIKQADERNYTPEPQRPGGDVHEKAAPPKGLKPEEKKDEGNPALTELDIGPEDPGVDLNKEQQS